MKLFRGSELGSTEKEHVMFVVSPYTLIALTTSYLAVSALLAVFYVVFAKGPGYRVNAAIALAVLTCSGTLAVWLWSTRILWG